MMGRLLVVATAILGVFVLAPISSASADDTFTGVCTVSGNATFTTPLTAVPGSNGYNFSGPGECDGSLNGGSVKTYFATAAANGTGTLGCTVSDSGIVGSGGGTGTVNAYNDAGHTSLAGSISFGVDLAGAGTEVAFNLSGNGGGNAVGHASFADPANAGAPAACAGSGVGSLKFNIQAVAVGLAG
jgi:hypothetical protein